VLSTLSTLCTVQWTEENCSGLFLPCTSLRHGWPGLRALADAVLNSKPAAGSAVCLYYALIRSQAKGARCPLDRPNIDVSGQGLSLVAILTTSRRPELVECLTNISL
jgi:hypothetical protein